MTSSINHSSNSLTEGGYQQSLLASSPEKSESKENEKTTELHSIAFGKEQWNVYFGDVGEVPALPDDIEDILSSACPFFSDRKVRETHLLVLIPKEINGKPLTFESLAEFVKNPKLGNATQFKISHENMKTEFEKRCSGPSHWVLMTRYEIPDTLSMSFNHQDSLIEKHKEYSVPKLLDATVCILMEYIIKGNRLFDTNFTRCQESFYDLQSIVGEFTKDGLHINCSYDYSSYYGQVPYALAAMRTLTKAT